jgi:hypothetical protein
MSKSSSKHKLEILKSWKPISLKDIKVALKNKK